MHKKPLLLFLILFKIRICILEPSVFEFLNGSLLRRQLVDFFELPVHSFLSFIVIQRNSPYIALFHVQRCARGFRSLLSEVITAEAAAQTTHDGKTILSSWSEAKCLLKPDPRYSKMPSKDREYLWRRYAEDMMRKQKPASDSKEKPDTDGRHRTASDFSRRSPRRSHGRG